MRSDATPFPGWSRVSLDNRIVTPEVHADRDALHADYAKLCAEDPVHRTGPTGYRSFRPIARRADIAAIATASDRRPVSFGIRIDLDDPEHSMLGQATTCRCA